MLTLTPAQLRARYGSHLTIEDILPRITGSLSFETQRKRMRRVIHADPERYGAIRVKLWKPGIIQQPKWILSKAGASRLVADLNAKARA